VAKSNKATKVARGAIRRRITKRQLAEALGVSTDTVERRVMQGKLAPGLRDGGRDYWFEDQLVEYNARLQTAAKLEQ
jgi:hypothetical protein